MGTRWEGGVGTEVIHASWYRQVHGDEIRNSWDLLCWEGRVWSVYSGSEAPGDYLAGVGSGVVCCGVGRGSGWRVHMVHNCVLRISRYVV